MTDKTFMRADEVAEELDVSNLSRFLQHIAGQVL